MRIVILTYESFFSNLMTEHLLKTMPGDVVGIVRSDCLIHGKSLPGGLLHLLKRTGLRFVGRKALELFQSRATAITFRLIGRQPKVNSLRTMRIMYNVPIIGSVNVNQPETLQQLKAWQPDLVLSVYLNQLIKRPLLDIPTQGTLNIHPALLPRHRGLFPYFWIIAQEDTETGVTIHWVDEKFDTGDVLLQEKIIVNPSDTITTLSHKSAVLGADMLVKAVQMIAAGMPSHITQNEAEASYHTWPTPADQRQFRKAGGHYGTIFELWKYM
ncbi:formyltransferase family protein [Anaerolineales bacterium HSG6]|nr:formyltransferase family protein [Anaerolineales bacterium HSG6]MDM8530048.1 formyltransferase family protein [Anaerolineales bacterium HSG25]